MSRLLKIFWAICLITRSMSAKATCSQEGGNLKTLRLKMLMLFYPSRYIRTIMQIY